MHNPQPIDQSIRLRDVQFEDIGLFFRFQCDPEAGYMAAFGARKPADQERHYAQWERICADPSLIKQMICYNDIVVGNMLCYEEEGRQEVGYWIDRAYWGLGIASSALRLFLKQFPHRPLYARCVVDNLGSQRVLEKNGFLLSAQETGFSEVRNADVQENIYILS